ncbi:hypothetical protein DY000_02015541 [Brassica cretica]|uniref:Uncharacterized protein n=1 Tax=Brassica cretica TaxID=69181 RepID=A0ABQ7CLZ6_BRACR|nr:hypothetical protein DY000_02015541 [Brassica cretica]
MVLLSSLYTPSSLPVTSVFLRNLLLLHHLILKSSAVERLLRVVGIKNGCDEVNLCGGNASHRTRARKGSLRSDRARAEARSLRSNRARVEARSLGSDRARAEVRSLRSDRALLKCRYNIRPCILVYPSMLSPEDHSEPISRSPPF